MFEAKFGGRGLFYWAVRCFERMTYAVADVVLVTNRSVMQLALDRGGKLPWNVFEVRTAPKIATTQAKLEPVLRKGRRFLVGYVGVMGNADGVDYLVNAAAHVVQKLGRQDVQFLLMGTGPEHAGLVALRDKLGLKDYVDLPGRVSNDFLFSALRTIDLGVACDPINPYNDHCTMNKTLEYMAFGKPQVLFGTKEGRASAGDSACYVEENSVEKLAQAIVDTLDDREGCSRMGRLGEERMRTVLNWERSVEQLLLAYSTALKR